MKLTIELDNGQKQEVEIPISEKNLILGSIQHQLGKLNAEMIGHLRETTERDKKLLSNFIRGKITAYKEISKILTTI